MSGSSSTTSTFSRRLSGSVTARFPVLPKARRVMIGRAGGNLPLGRPPGYLLGHRHNPRIHPMRLLPKNENFYELFAEIAQRLSGSAVLLHKLFEDPANRGSYVSQIKRLEHEADYLTHDVSLRIDKTFGKPFDRQELHR